MTITIEQKDQIAYIEGKTCSVMSYALVNLLFSNDNKETWMNSNFVGVLCFIIDRKVCTNFIKIYDLNDYSVPFEMETPVNLNSIYYVVENNFHCFQMRTGHVGLYFYIESDAIEFKKKVVTHAGKLDNDEMISIKKSLELKNIEKKKKNAQKGKVEDIPKQNNKKSSIFGIFSRKPKAKEEKKKDVKISKPKDLKRLAHAGYDENLRKFVIDDIPKEYKIFFKEKGIGKKDLEDENIAPLIYQALNEPCESNRSSTSESTRSNTLSTTVSADVRTPSPLTNNKNIQRPPPPPLPRTNIPRPPPPPLPRVNNARPPPPRQPGQPQQSQNQLQQSQPGAPQKGGPPRGIPPPPPRGPPRAPPPPPAGGIKKSWKQESDAAKEETPKPKPQPKLPAREPDLLSQIKQGIKLKKMQIVDVNNISKKQADNLGQKLSAVILQRRQQLTKYDLPDEDNESSSGSDWSD